MNLYFAYGMNLDPRNMFGMVEAGAAKLRGWKLTFKHYADVEPSEGDVVHGALWHLTPRALTDIDRREGYTEGSDYSLYNRHVVSVDNGDEQVQALVYSMNPLRHPRIAAPQRYYVQTVLEGYRHFGLPEEPLWAALRASCTGAAEFRSLYEFATKEAQYV